MHSTDAAWLPERPQSDFGTFFVGEGTAEPSVEDHGVSFGAGAGTYETTVNPPETANDVQLDLSGATFSSGEDQLATTVVRRSTTSWRDCPSSVMARRRGD